MQSHLFDIAVVCTKSPYTIVDELLTQNHKNNHSLNILESIFFKMLLQAYICAQFGFFTKLNESQLSIILNHGSNLVQNLKINCHNCKFTSEELNYPMMIWARQNGRNFNWTFQAWVYIACKYHQQFNKNIETLKFTGYFVEAQSAFKLQNENC